ncbi:DUF393 domain-containing protein [Candidatus Kaiserbacteria bacterium]|nr:DUF393 domain-containing protein [Candidatus Kaiserbacteria bacterium]USN88873.1 MAG: DUF393 domain-containing protein [Candidatus Nomurabacteria bacterium]
MSQKVPQKPKVAIYYDGNCGFCRRGVELIVRYFLVHTSHTGPAQADSGMYAIMQKYDSWVVVNEKGETFTTFQAGVEVARHSSILWILVPLARPRFMQRFGEWFYRLIARNRSRIWLP